MDLDEELDELQDDLTEQALKEAVEKEQMHVDNRSIYTIRDEIIKRAEPEENDKQ